MSIANSTTCETPSRQAPVAAAAVRPAAGPTNHPRSGVYSLPATCQSRAWRAARGRDGHPAVGWQVREDADEYDIPDPTEDEGYEPDPALDDAAYAHTEGQREAMALLDDAENLLAVLFASIEDDGDSRAMQAEAVLKIVRKKLRKAHTRIDRQESRHRDLFLAYFELKARSEKGAE